MNKLMVLLPHAKPQAQDRLWGWQVTAEAAVQPMACSVAELARSKPASTVVVVPARCLSWHSVVVPATVKLQGDGRLLPVLHSLLEESLLDEPELMHIALMPGAAVGQPCVLAVCEKAWLSAWLETLERAGMHIERLVPEMAPDVLQEAAVCSSDGEQRTWLTCWHAQLPVTVPLHAGAATLESAPEYHAMPAAFREAEQLFGSNAVKLLSEQEWVQRILQSQWDLMQHGFASSPLERMRRKWRAGWRDVWSAPQWRASRIAVAALAMVSAVGLNVQAWTQRQALAAQREAVIQTAQRTFPQLRVVIDAPLQMQRELQQLRQAAGVESVTDLEPMAAAAGAALHSAGLRIQQLEYDGTHLRVHGVAPQHWAAVNEQLKGSRYAAEFVGDGLQLKVRR